MILSYLEIPQINSLTAIILASTLKLTIIAMKLISLPLIFSCILVGKTTCLVANKEKLQNYQGSTITDQTLRKLLEKTRLMLHNPQAIPDKHIFINQTEIFLNASLTSGSVKDPTSFNIETAHVDMQTLEFTTKVSYTALTISGIYSVNMDNQYAHLQSTDHFSVAISDMASSMFIKLNLTQDKTLQLEKFILDYNMTVKVDFKYLGGNSEVSDTMNNLMNQLMPEIIKSTKPDVQEMANKMVLEKSKFLLSGMTLQQLIDLINSFAG